MLALGVVGIIIGIVLLIFLAYRGYNVVIVAPLCGLLVALFCGMNLLSTFNEVIVPAVGNYVVAMFGPVVMGLVIAGFYQASGAAQSIANVFYTIFTYRARKNAKEGEAIALRPIVAIVLIYVIGVSLAYGGLNPFVILFIILPIALDVFEKACIPREMACGVILGALATAASSMPGTASDQNVLCSTFLDTNAMAAAIPGFIGGAVVLGLNIMARKNIANGFVYTKPTNLPPRVETRDMPHWIIAIIPLVVTIFIYNVLKTDVVVALAANIILSIVLFWKYFGKVEGMKALLMPVPKQAAEILLQVGALGALGAIIAASPVFPQLTEAIVSVKIPGLFKVVICIALLTGVAGSGPAGLSASLPYLGGTFAQLGISANAIHRVAAFSCQTLDTLPTNPGFAVATAATDVPMSKSYKYVFVTTVLNTTIAAFVVAFVLTMFPGLA